MLSIVLPAYNEAAGLSDLLDRVRAAVHDRMPAYEIVVVDDGSTDATASIAEAAAERMPLRLVRHPANQGYGRALRTGILDALERADVVVTLDADESHDPALVLELVAAIEAGADVVVASRFVEGGREVGVPWNRRILSHGASLLYRIVLPVPGVRDYTCGYRAFRAGFLETVVDRLGRDDFLSEAGFAAGLELLLQVAEAGAEIVEVPLVLRYDQKQSESKMRVGRTMARHLAMMARQLGRRVRSGSGALASRRTGG